MIAPRTDPRESRASYAAEPASATPPVLQARWPQGAPRSYVANVSPRPLSKIPRPHRRWFAEHPHERRRVVVRVGAFTGHALHFHVTMREEHDRVWAADRGCWETPTDDPVGEGRERMMKFRTHDQAWRWVEATFHEEFGEETHELVHEELPPRWTYYEGD